MIGWGLSSIIVVAFLLNELMSMVDEGEGGYFLLGDLFGDDRYGGCVQFVSILFGAR
jgi:hypothetical protein